MRSNSLVHGLMLGMVMATLQSPRVAVACGCFHTEMTSASPVVQAGERILFVTDQGQVTAHIQIQYSGAASDFGWLLPLPSLPTLEVGSNDLFAKLQALTAPVFTLTTTYDCNSNSTTLCVGFGANASSGGFYGGAPDMAPPSPLVIADSIGPYDYAVLKADDATALLDWLKQNHYSTPPGSDALVTPYIHPGAFFLALKLHAGKSAGDIQPIVVHYASDLPMIPLRLTALSAVPQMGVLVWMLGETRAIPRNYYHVVVNEGALNWTTAANYDDLLVRAIGEAPNHHAFVTEYAGTSKILVGKISSTAYNAAIFAAITDALAFVIALKNMFPYPFTPPLSSILAARLPEPKELVAEGLKAEDFYTRPVEALQHWKDQYPNAAPIVFDAKTAAGEIDQRVAAPLRTTAGLFAKYPYLTRLHTVLAPADMTADPVFSFNPDLPEVSNHRTATLANDCDGNADLITADVTTFWPAGRLPSGLPASLRIETLSEAGAPMVLTNNTDQSHAKGGGCALTRKGRRGGDLCLIALAVLLVRLGRRKRRGV